MALTVKLEPGYVAEGAALKVMVGVAGLMVTFWVPEAAVKFVVAATLAWTTQVPAPEELSVAEVAVVLTIAQGPLETLKPSVPLELVVAVTVKLGPG